MEITGRWILRRTSTELGGRTCGDLRLGSQFDASLNLVNPSIEEVPAFVNIPKVDFRRNCRASSQCSRLPITPHMAVEVASSLILNASRQRRAGRNAGF